MENDNIEQAIELLQNEQIRMENEILKIKTVIVDLKTLFINDIPIIKAQITDVLDIEPQAKQEIAVSEGNLEEDISDVPTAHNGSVPLPYLMQLIVKILRQNPKKIMKNNEIYRQLSTKYPMLPYSKSHFSRALYNVVKNGDARSPQVGYYLIVQDKNEQDIDITISNRLKPGTVQERILNCLKEHGSCSEYAIRIYIKDIAEASITYALNSLCKSKKIICLFGNYHINPEYKPQLSQYQIIKQLYENEPERKFNTSNIHELTGINHASIHTINWQLKKGNVIERIERGFFILNKTQEPS